MVSANSTDSCASHQEERHSVDDVKKRIWLLACWRKPVLLGHLLCCNNCCLMGVELNYKKFWIKRNSLSQSWMTGMKSVLELMPWYLRMRLWLQHCQCFFVMIKSPCKESRTCFKQIIKKIGYACMCVVVLWVSYCEGWNKLWDRNHLLLLFFWGSRELPVFCLKL